jgi:hypothetical protein
MWTPDLSRESGADLPQQNKNQIEKPPHMKNTKLTTDQHWAIRCACADLIGSLEGKNKRLDHDWKGHKQTIAELLSAFPDVLSDFKTGNK